MKKYLIFIPIFFICTLGFSQNSKYPFRKLTLEPAIGLRLSSVLGLIDIQLSGLVQKQINKRVSVASHSAVSFDLNTFNAFKNIDVKYSTTTFQKFGIGTSIYQKNSSHNLFLMAGAKYFMYSASINNPKLEDNVKSKFNTISFDKGLLYNIKIGTKNPYFSGRFYAPIFDGKWIFIENASLEFGAGFKLK